MSAKITTEVLTDLNKQTDIDQKDPDAVAKAWLATNGSLPATKVAKTGPTIVVGSANFTEDATLADIYADLLQANGYPVKKKLNIGSREIYFPALKSDQISFVPDYAGSLLTFIDPKQAGHHRPRDQRDQAGRGVEAAGCDGVRLRARAGHQRVRGDEGHGRQVQAREALRPREPR